MCDVAESDQRWDVFISHAHEDKAEIVQPLAEALRAQGLGVWYDDFSLRLGDSLRESIDTGLRRSRYGVVVLSERFFEKHWPTQELNALATREANGEKVILPVWHKVSFEQVRHYSPLLADKFAIQTSRGLPRVVDAVLGIVGPVAQYSESAVVAKLTAQVELLKREFEQSHDILLETLADVLDLRAAEPDHHAKRVTAYTIAIGRVMQLPAEQVRVIGRGAFLHDIGKIALPDSVLQKRGKLTHEEADIMKTHCRRGYRMICKVPFLKEAAEIVYAHQEWWDGSGYPRKLTGERIPLGARMVAVADTLEAMTIEQCYRKATSFSEAREEIQRRSGTQFDPAVVSSFMKIPLEIWSEIRAEIERERQ